MTRFLGVLLCLAFALLGGAEGFMGSPAGLPDGIYCGRDNCYDVLGVEQNASGSEIRKAYRSLAQKLHPDRNKEPDADEKFMKVAAAYETLKDADARGDYDYMLAHPEERYANYYRYYKRQIAPKVDPRVVIAGLVLVISSWQWLIWNNRYSFARKALLRDPKNFQKAKITAQQMGLGADLKRIKRENDQRKFLLDNVPFVVHGGYSKPVWTDVLLVRLCVLPYTLYRYLHWYASWTWRINVRKEEYTEEDVVFLTRRALGISHHTFVKMEDHKRLPLLERKLWIRANHEAWKKELEQQEMEKNPALYKRWKRWQKKEAAGY